MHLPVCISSFLSLAQSPVALRSLPLCTMAVLYVNLVAMAAAYTSRGFKNLNLAPAAGEKRETLVAVSAARKNVARASATTPP